MEEPEIGMKKNPEYIKGLRSAILHDFTGLLLDGDTEIPLSTPA